MVQIDDRWAGCTFSQLEGTPARWVVTYNRKYQSNLTDLSIRACSLSGRELLGKRVTIGWGAFDIPVFQPQGNWGAVQAARGNEAADGRGQVKDRPRKSLALLPVLRLSWGDSSKTFGRIREEEGWSRNDRVFKNEDRESGGKERRYAKIE